MQSLLRVRENYIAMKTQVSNQLRGLMAEYGCIVKKNYAALRTALPSLFERGKENGLTVAMKQVLERQYQLLLSHERAIDELEIELASLSKQNEHF